MTVRARTLEDQWHDPLWRLNNLYTIVDAYGKRIPFRMNDAQCKFAQDMSGLDINLKARQLGFTTFYCLYMLDACVFYPDISAGVIAHNLNDAQSFFKDKVKFPYDQLDDAIKAANPATTDAAASLAFANNSGLRVGTSLRSGTLQYLLISEYGKTCAKYPDKAREIRTGALNTIQPGQHLCIESTAEGREGHFFELCEEARNRQSLGASLTDLDFKFHFFPWYADPKYVLDPEHVVIPEVMADYFDTLGSKGVKLTAEQKAWYTMKERQQGEDMKREFPSTPDEAFEAAVQGAYFARQMRQIREQKRICTIPVEPELPVNTFWDLGLNDMMVIWFHQQHGNEHRFVNYLEDHGEGFSFYKRQMEKWADRHDVTWGKHFGPHDINVRSLTEVAETRKEAAERVGISFETVAAPKVKMDGITASRNALASCWFDEAACEQGVKHLDMYRKKWDDKLGSFRDDHVHDDASHGADGFQTFALAKQADMIGEDQIDWSSQEDSYAGEGGWMGA